MAADRAAESGDLQYFKVWCNVFVLSADSLSFFSYRRCAQREIAFRVHRRLLVVFDDDIILIPMNGLFLAFPKQFSQLSALTQASPSCPQALPAEDLARIVKRKDEDGRTLLHTAAARGHTEIVELLLDAGASCNTADDEARCIRACVSAAADTASGELFLEESSSNRGPDGWQISVPAGLDAAAEREQLGPREHSQGADPPGRGRARREHGRADGASLRGAQLSAGERRHPPLSASSPPATRTTQPTVRGCIALCLPQASKGKEAILKILLEGGAKTGAKDSVGCGAGCLFLAFFSFACLA